MVYGWWHLPLSSCRGRLIIPIWLAFRGLHVLVHNFGAFRDSLWRPSCRLEMPIPILRRAIARDFFLHCFRRLFLQKFTYFNCLGSDRSVSWRELCILPRIIMDNHCSLWRFWLVVGGGAAVIGDGSGDRNELRCCLEKELKIGIGIAASYPIRKRERGGVRFFAEFCSCQRFSLSRAWFCGEMRQESICSGKFWSELITWLSHMV